MLGNVIVIIATIVKRVIFYRQQSLEVRTAAPSGDAQRLAAWRSGGGTQKLERAINFQIPAKLSASKHPD